MVDARELRTLTLVMELGRFTSDPGYADFVRRTVLDAPTFAELRQYLDTDRYACLTPRAARLRSQSAQLIEELFAGDLRQCVSDAEANLAQFRTWHVSAQRALRGAGYTTATLDVLEAGEAADATELLDALVRGLVYASCLFRGPEAAQPFAYLEFTDLASSFATINLYLDKFVFSGPARATPWAIVAHDAAGDLLPERSGFWLVDLPGTAAEFARLRGLPELAVGLYGGDEGSVVAAGEGYLVGTAFDEALMLTSVRLHSRLPADAFGSSEVQPGDPLPLLGAAFADHAFCVHPRDYVRALNRNAELRASAMPRTRARCLVCGAFTPGARICGRH